MLRTGTSPTWLGIWIAVAAAGTACAPARSGEKPPLRTDVRDVGDVGDVGARVDAFWTWWRTASSRVAAALDGRNREPVVRELTARVHALDPGLAWEVGPGLKGAHYQLVLSSEGDFALRILAERWRSRAPASDRAWEYYPARQAAIALDAEPSLGLHDAANTQLELAAARVAFETDALREIVHVTFHHPALASLRDGERTRAASLVLDKLLGEDGVERWIGRIETSPQPLADGKPLAALADAVAALGKTTTGNGYATVERRTASGRPLIAAANVALKRLDHLLMDDHLEVVMPLREQAANGMPTVGETAALDALEDELLTALGRDAIWIAHETGDGRRTVHLHVAAHGPAEPRATAWARKHPDRRIAIHVRHDPAWDVLQKWSR